MGLGKKYNLNDTCHEVKKRIKESSKQSWLDRTVWLFIGELWYS